MAKKKVKPKRSSKRYSLYQGSERKNKFCPKCGMGIFMAKHNDRLSCGKCGYTEFESKKPKDEKKAAKEAPKSEKKAPEKKS